MSYIFLFGAAVLGAFGLFAAPLPFVEAPFEPRSAQVGQEMSDQNAPRPARAILVVGTDTYEASVPEGSSVYDFMKLLRAEKGLGFSGKDFQGLGFFVEEINGLRQNPREGMRWIYYINYEKAKVGISQQLLQANDVIEWKYETEE